ncbi:MAG: M1 family aminopeptidase [Planctomycetota bacterium]
MTLEAFEYWFGKYPFYEDSYKLVSVPYLGMEHQSSVTYGNGFKNGYPRRDTGRTGVGKLFDYIIIHESAHEWWGNNVSMRDSADMWIHESFGTYAENLYVEYHFGEEKAQDYVIEPAARIRNDKPIIGIYGVNESGSGDMYPKGANILHTLRHALGNTERWREILRGISAEFWHKTITTEQMETFLAKETGLDLGPFFDQYLRTAAIPVLKYRPTADGGSVDVWFENVVPGFHLPVLLRVNGEELRMDVAAYSQAIPLHGPFEKAWSSTATST